MLPFSDNHKAHLPIKSHVASYTQAKQPLLHFWHLLILGCLIAGLLLRCVNLGDKVYWYDEAFTFLRISGHTEAEAVQALDSQKPEGQEIIASGAFQPYQQLNPDKGLADTIRGLAIEEPQHTPLYYGLVRLWAGWFGSSVSAIRSFSVLASILALPCMAWLCWELFQSPFASGLGTAILAVSPFQIVYAQEARPTALWTTTILLASAALLRAMRTKAQADWVLYGITLVTSFYAYLFSGLIAIVHTIYVLWVERLRLSHTLLLFSVALGASVLLFSPWLLILATNSTQVNTVTQWVTVDNQYTFISLVRQWAYHLILPFVDRGELILPPGLHLLDYMARWCVRLLIIVSFYWLWQRESVRVWLFVFLLTGVPALMLTLPDVLYGGKRSTIPRYLVPVYLGLELAVVYGLSQQWRQFKVLHHWRRLAWQALTVFILGAGVATSALIVQSDVWWNKAHSMNVPRLAQIINQAERPLVISDAEMADLFALNHYLEPKVRLLLRPQCYACQVSDPSLLDSPYLPPIPQGFSDVFLYNPRPSNTWLSRLEQAPYSIKPLSEGFNNWFWKIEL
jgi:uncharacterized membrane protein